MRTNSFPDLIKRILEERTAANSAYSLRALARDLNVYPSHLSEILNGKKGVSKKMAKEICTKLGLIETDVSYYEHLAESTYSRSLARRHKSKEILLKRYQEEEVAKINDDVFRVISDWYHYAILDLIECDGFQSDPSYVAKELLISEEEAKNAVERLLRVNLIKLQDGRYVNTSETCEVNPGQASESIRKFTSQILAKAAVAINSQPINERYVGTLTTAVHEDDLKKCGEMIEIFRMELNKFINKKNRERKPNKVYCLVTEFFKLSR